jgi:hypothetical protein
MGFHGSGMATQAVDLVSGAASNVAASAVSRAYEACHTRQAPTCLTSDKAFYVNGVPLDYTGVFFPYLLWQCRKIGNDDFLSLGDALLDFRRFVEYGSLSSDSGSSIPEKYHIPKIYERIHEGEMGEGWTMRSAVQLDNRGDGSIENSNRWC